MKQCLKGHIYLDLFVLAIVAGQTKAAKGEKKRSKSEASEKQPKKKPKTAAEEGSLQVHSMNMFSDQCPTVL